MGGEASIVAKTLSGFLVKLTFFFTGTGSQSRENKDEEHNEERKKNNTNYNKGKLSGGSILAA